MIRVHVVYDNDRSNKSDILARTQMQNQLINMEIERTLQKL